MRSATRWLPCQSLDHHSITVDVRTPARRSSRRALWTRRRTTSHGRRRRFDGRAPTSGRGVVEHVRRGPLRHVVHLVHILLPDTMLYLYLFCIAFMCLRIYNVTAYSTSVKSAVMTAVAARSSFVCSFAVSSFVFAFHSRLFTYHLPLNFYMRDAESNFLVTYRLDLASYVIFCILSALR